MVIGNRVYFGCECGEMFALNTKTGKTQWSTQLGGEIKAAPAYEKGLLYAGDYSGTMSAIRASNGEIVWQNDSLGTSLGRAGAFYATPAVAFGRVYSGNNDSRVYSFDAETGETAWTYSTGSYVYSGTAVADTESTEPTVYVGSIDQSIYALDAKSGELRWQESAGGPVIGSLSIVGDVVYVATFEGTTTTGRRLKDGKKIFEYPTGAYMPVISDGRRIYLTGYSSIHALDPVGARQAKAGKQKQSGGFQQNKAEVAIGAG
jgi:outer membrane protein assembly factor BamB